MKKITIYKIIFLVLVITAIVLLGLITKEYIENEKIKKQAEQVLDSIKLHNTSNNQLDIIQEIDEEINGYKVIGIIK